MELVSTPFTKEAALRLHSGDNAAITGTIYTARDAAHARLLADYDATGAFPFPMEDAILYYAGPSPARPGQAVGAIGPTTSYRMDGFAPRLMRLGLRGMIGKGLRSDEVKQAMGECSAVYFGAVGGAGALLAQRVKSAALVAYPELGAEAIYRLEVENFPVVVVMDAHGGDLYQRAKEMYQR